jgi:hypothetical protein
MQKARIFLPLCSPAKTHARVSFDAQALADEAGALDGEDDRHDWAKTPKSPEFDSVKEKNQWRRSRSLGDLAGCALFGAAEGRHGSISYSLDSPA